ncbi:MAG: CoA transferase [Thermodesulfobacteriota bacterium]|jgi:crotonobetainyl-CoA:carnitine CoA-transferase CaiB-like acyl-CoA transferase
MLLTGVKVIEVGLNLAGPLAGEILADLGAEVIKVERPEGGDDARGWGPPFVQGSSVTFHSMNRNKRSITVDFKNPDELARLRRLIGEADIFLHNLRPGVAEEVGLGAEALLELNPRLIYCAISAFGHQGPLRLKPGYEILLQAFAGLMSVTGEADGPPVRMGTSVVDFGTGMWAAIAALAALYQRDQTGRGCVIHASLFETALFWLCNFFARYLASGEVPQRHATGSPTQVAFGAFETKNGPLVIGVANDRLFAKFARALNRPEWAEDPRFRTSADRLAHRDLLVGEIRAMLRQATKEQWMKRLEAAGIPCAPILTIPEVLAQPQTEALGMLRTPPGAEVKVLSLPLSFDGARPALRHRAPSLGEHNAEVFGADKKDE